MHDNFKQMALDLYICHAGLRRPCLSQSLEIPARKIHSKKKHLQKCIYVIMHLKKMKRHKAPGLSGLVTEMIQATGDTVTQWILDLCNGIVKEGSIPEDWKSSVVLPIYKGKDDPMECGSYRGIKLLEHAMKVVERIFEP